MPSLTFQVVSWPALGTALLVFGFAPGVVLRVIVLAYPRNDARRRELLGELYRVPWIERPFWVMGKLEVAFFEGLPGRFARRTAHDLRQRQLRELREIVAHGMTERLLDYGIPLPQSRSATSHVRDGPANLTWLVLMNDGVSISECTSADEVQQLLNGGQATHVIESGPGEWVIMPGDDFPRPPCRVCHGA